MKYKIRKYSNFKRRNVFETYEPKKRFITRGQSIPLVIRIGRKFLFLGGIISLFFSGIIFGIKSFFGIKKKVNRMGKTIEFRIKGA
ncbi:MAG: hypothetical protein WC438_01925 [Candidatus Pacearchaeota archaeon]